MNKITIREQQMYDLFHEFKKSEMDEQSYTIDVWQGWREGWEKADETMVIKAIDYIEKNVFKYMPFVEESVKEKIIDDFMEEMRK